MFKQLIIVLVVVVGVVLCQDQVEGPSTTAKPKHSFGKGLLDFGIIAAKNAKRTIDESKPTFNSLKKSFVGKVNKLRNNPNVKKGLEAGKKQVDEIVNNPNVQKGLESGKKQVEAIGKKLATNEHVQAANAKAQPIIQQGKAQLDKVISEVDAKGRALKGKILAEHKARQEALKNGQQVDEPEKDNEEEEELEKEVKPAAQEEQQQQ